MPLAVCDLAGQVSEHSFEARDQCRVMASALPGRKCDPFVPSSDSSPASVSRLVRQSRPAEENLEYAIVTSRRRSDRGCSAGALHASIRRGPDGSG